MRHPSWKYLLFFLSCLILLTLLYKKGYRGTVGGDGHYYYSYAVSIVWDGDLDLRNQYDHALPYQDGTAANDNYFIDKNTGKAFTFFNPGAGLFMIPTTWLSRAVQSWRNNDRPDPFDARTQFYAHYAAVIVASVSLLLLFILLNRYYSILIAIALPFVFLFGTNWLFYTVTFPNWSHTYSLFCNVALIWAFLTLLEKNTFRAAALFGLIGGLAYSTRNFNLILLVLLSLAYIKSRSVRQAIPLKRKVLNLSLAFLFSLVGALPQFAVKFAQHGHPLASSYKAAQLSDTPFSFIKEEAWVEGLVFGNFHLLHSNLLNNENGLFFYHPLFFIGLIGAVLLRPKKTDFRKVTNVLLVALALFWLVDTAYWDNWFMRAAGAGFGHRRYVDIIPIFLFGAASLWSRAASKKSSGILFILLMSLFVGSGLSLYTYFLADYPSVYSHRDTFPALFGFLMGKKLSWIAASAAFLILLMIGRKRQMNFRTMWQKAPVIAVMMIIFILPGFLFKPDPYQLRKKHFLRDGFFLLYTWNPFVGLKAADWRLPGAEGRPLLTSKAGIKLPAPLKEGDRILFKVKAVPSSGNPSVMAVYMGDEFIGKAPLREGMQIYEFELKSSPVSPRELNIAVASEKDAPPYALFYEGRILYKDKNRRLREDLNWVEIKGTEVTAQGWCLDDHRIKFIGLYGNADANSLNVFLGKAIRFPESQTVRPDVDRIFVLYPELYTAAYEARALLPESFFGKDARFWVEVVSEDGEVKRSKVISKKIPENTFPERNAREQK